MHDKDLVILAVAGLLAFFLLKRPATAAGIGRSPTVPATGRNDYANQIVNQALPGDDAWGWSYYTDGVAISPDGVYYKNGVRIWSPSLTA